MEPITEETTQLIPCVTEKYIYIRVVELYANQKTRVNVTDIGNGTTWGEPSWGELVVGFVRLDKQNLQEELKPGTIDENEYRALKRQLRCSEELPDKSTSDKSAF